LYYGLLGASAVAYAGATEFVPELNSWLQLVPMSMMFKIRLSLAMILDFGLCWAMEKGCKALFADLAPAEIVTRGEDRRIKRRAEEAAQLAKDASERAVSGVAEKLPELEAVRKQQ
jgi:cation-transporting ATPase 13A1